MARVYLPGSLIRLFPGAPRHVEVAAATVGEAIAWLEAHWPGMSSRLCDTGPALRPHIKVFVDGEPATLCTPIAAASEVLIVPAVSGG
jgi:molybdopterin synthase sulfur carrier subunit